MDLLTTISDTLQRGDNSGVAEDASIIGLSALLTTTMAGMRDVVELVQQRGLADRIRIIVGSAPLSQIFADEIGAAGYGYDAGSAVELVKSLVGPRDA